MEGAVDEEDLTYDEWIATLKGRDRNDLTVDELIALDAADPEMVELEATIAALVKQKNAAPMDSAEYRFFERQLNGLRYSREHAGPIWESLDDYWGATPLENAEHPEGQLLPLVRKPVSRSE